MHRFYRRYTTVILTWIAIFVGFAGITGSAPIKIMREAKPSKALSGTVSSQIIKANKEVSFKGRLAFNDWTDCSGGLFKKNMADCNQYKRLFDPDTGAALTGDEFYPNGMRPISATVEVSYAFSQPTQTVCPKSVTQTDQDGFFQVSLKPCIQGSSQDWSDFVTQGQRASVPTFITEPDTIKVRTILKFQMQDPLGVDSDQEGEIRALWSQSDIKPIYDVPLPLAYSWQESDGLTHYFYPTFETTLPNPSVTSIDAGVIALPGEDVAANFRDYLRLVLLDWQTVVQLQQRLRDAFAQSERKELYKRLFQPAVSNKSLNKLQPTVTLNRAPMSRAQTEDHLSRHLPAEAVDKALNLIEDRPGFFRNDPDRNCHNCFTVMFIAEAHSYGTSGLMILAKPKLDIIIGDAGAESFVSHELGHALHGTLARNSFKSGFKSKGSCNTCYITEDGEKGGAMHHKGQIHSMYTALIEGVATGIGQYLRDGCKNGHSSFPPGSQRQGVWRSIESCESMKRCTANRFAWQMAQRGIVKDSPEWERRWGLIQKLDSTGSSAARITSASEARYAMFTCDLLTANTDISHLYNGQRAGLSTGVNGPQGTTGDYFIDDYLYWIYRALDGHEDTITQANYRQYTGDVVAKDFQITLPQLLEALENFCPSCQDPERPELGDPAFAWTWMSRRGMFSPQRLGLYMVKRGWLSREQLNNVLRANFMEELWPESEDSLGPPSPKNYFKMLPSDVLRPSRKAPDSKLKIIR